LPFVDDFAGVASANRHAALFSDRTLVGARAWIVGARTHQGWRPCGHTLFEHMIYRRFVSAATLEARGRVDRPRPDFGPFEGQICEKANGYDTCTHP
jgi:hypothetical protein